MTLDAWADLTRDIMLVYSWAWIPMIAYVIITGFVVVNLVIAVICDAVAALHDDEKAKLSGQVVPQGDAQEQTPIVLPAVREQLSILEQHVDALSLGQTEALQKILELKQRLGEVNQRMINATQYISTMKEKVP